jgi:hypothetical protein
LLSGMATSFCSRHENVEEPTYLQLSLVGISYPQCVPILSDQDHDY